MAEKLHIIPHQHTISKENRERQNGHKGHVLWFTGLSGSGKSTVASAVGRELHQQGIRTFILDGDKAIKMNDIAKVKIRSTKPLFVDDYTVNRVTGSLILVDEATNETVAAGMIR